MDFTTILAVLALMGTVCSNPVKRETQDHCPVGCKEVTKYQQLDIYHIWDLKDTSVAPWTLEFNNETDRDPQSIQFAKCQDCSLPDMRAAPISIKIPVIKSFGDQSVLRCKCYFELAVGCTCVPNKTAQSQ